MWLVGNLQANNSQLSVECGGESAKGRGVRRAATRLIIATWKFVNACQAKRRTPVNNSLTDFLTSWLTEWVSEWMTDRRSANDNWNCLWLPTWFQFRLRLQPERKENKKKGSHKFLRYWCAFHGPKANQKRNSSPSLSSINLGPTAFADGPEGSWQMVRERRGGGASGDKVAGNRRKQLLIDFGLPFGIWQITCLSCCVADDVGRTVESVRRVVYMLQHFPPSPAPNSIPGLSQLRSLWQMCVDCWLKLPNWQTAEKRRLKKKWSRELSNSRKNRNKYRGQGEVGDCGGCYRNKATNLGFNK